MISGQHALTGEQERLLHEAAAWRLIGMLFECPRAGWHEQVAALGRESRDPRLRSAAEAAQVEASEGLHHSLFGPGGPVSPREVTYSGGVQMGYLLSEVRAYYDAFVFRPDTIEPDDHLSVESGFMAYLALKQAYALASASDEQARVTADAAAGFEADHLARMVEPIARALEIGGPPYLVLAAQALFERVGAAPRSTLLPADPSADSDDDRPICGTA
jgi:nitrate reductase assembly molybdenum cofactor insertion protein NarJ